MISQLGGVICRGPVGIIRWARELIWWEKELSRWSMWLMRTRRLMPSGRGNGYQRKRSGSGRRGEGRREKHIHGEMNFAPAGNGWPTLGRESFPIRTAAKTVGRELPPCESTQLILTVCTTYQGMSGSGAPTGIDQTAMRRIQKVG